MHYSTYKMTVYFIYLFISFFKGGSNKFVSYQVKVNVHDYGCDTVQLFKKDGIKTKQHSTLKLFQFCANLS